MFHRLVTLLSFYRQHKNHRVALLASFSTIRNSIYSLSLFVSALLSRSLLLLANSSYQLILSLVRTINVTSYAKAMHGRSNQGLQTVKRTGYLLLLLSMIYLGNPLWSSFKRI